MLPRESSALVALRAVCVIGSELTVASMFLKRPGEQQVLLLPRDLDRRDPAVLSAVTGPELLDAFKQARPAERARAVSNLGTARLDFRAL